MTQQPAQSPRSAIRAADIASAIMQSVMEAQTIHTYLAAVLKELGGEQTVSVDTLEKLRQEDQWEVVIDSVGEDKVQFRLLEGAAKINAALGRTAGGLIVP